MEESFVLVERERESRSRVSSRAAESSNTSRRAATIVDFDIANIVDDYRSHTAHACRTDNPAHRDTWTTDLGFDGCSAKNRSVVVHYLSRHQTTDPASSLPFGKPPSTSAQAAATPWRPTIFTSRPSRPSAALTSTTHTRTHADDTITDRSRSRNSSSPDVRCQIACQITLCSSSRRTTRTFSHTHTHIHTSTTPQDANAVPRNATHPAVARSLTAPAIAGMPAYSMPALVPPTFADLPLEACILIDGALPAPRPP